MDAMAAKHKAGRHLTAPASFATMSNKKFLDKVYDLQTVADTRALYDDWSETYDQEVGGKGYVTPDRIAAALVQFMPHRDRPILDFGCGTGISGAAMKKAGFSTIDGCDLSAKMLDHAGKKTAYRNLWLAGPNIPFPVKCGDYHAITAVGVISVGAAPPETMGMLVDALAPGGLLAFSFNDHTFDDPGFEQQVNSLLDNQICRQVFREDGEHLPGIGLRSTVFVLERL